MYDLWPLHSVINWKVLFYVDIIYELFKRVNFGACLYVGVHWYATGQSGCTAEDYRRRMQGLQVLISFHVCYFQQQKWQKILVILKICNSSALCAT